MSRLRTAATVCLFLFFAGPVSAAEPLRIVASFSVLADIAVQVGGERVVVGSLVGPGSEPHAWSPRPQDVTRLAGADLVIVNGLGLEGWLYRLVAASGYEGPVLVLGRNVTPLLNDAGAPDPHAWHSPVNAQLYAGAIAAALVELDPAGAPAYRRNLEGFNAELNAMLAWAESEIAGIPPQHRIVVATHDSFAYLGRDFGITVHAPAGRDSAAQLSAQRVAELVVLIRKTGVDAVFLEAGADARLAWVLASEAGVGVGPPLYAGTLSAPDGPAADYVSMWLYNFGHMLRAMRR